MFSFVQYIWDMYILTTLFVSCFLNSVFYEHKASYEIKKYSRKISSIMLHCNMTNNHAMENLVATFSFFHLKPNRYYHILWLLEQTQCLPDTWCCTVYLPLRNVLTHRWFFFCLPTPFVVRVKIEPNFFWPALLKAFKNL